MNHATRSTSNSSAVRPQVEYRKVHVVAGCSDSKYLSTIRIIEIEENTSVQQISDEAFIVRGYAEGHNHPSPHEWAVTMIKDGTKYHSFGFTSTNGNMRASQFRAVHKFFHEMGCRKHVYARAKAGIKDWVVR